VLDSLIKGQDNVCALTGRAAEQFEWIQVASSAVTLYLDVAGHPTQIRFQRIFQAFQSYVIDPDKP
jgi:hypothetical protein